MIFVTGFLGGTHGTAQSARDFLRAMLAAKYPVQVISPEREAFPTMLCGSPLSVPLWIEKPQRVLLPRRFWRWRMDLLRKWADFRKSESALYRIGRTETVIVNGWASITYWRTVERYFCSRKALIVRESPRHFTGSDCCISIAEMIGTIAEFDFLIFVSENCQKEWLGFPQLRSKRSFCLPNCCEEELAAGYVLEDKRRLRDRLGLRSEEFSVICPGAIEQRKGQDILLETLPELVAQIPNLRVVLIGDATTQWGKNLIAGAMRQPFSRKISYWPSCPGILDMLYASDVLAFPSRAEALPRTILEAMALKLPIVAAAVDGVSELIEDGRTGLLFQSGDRQGLLQGLLRFSAEPSLRQQMAENGWTRYWQFFSRKRQFERMKEILAVLAG